MRTIAAGLALAVTGAAAAQGRPEPNRPPAASGGIAAFFGPDAYPVEAMRAKEQGRVVARLAISPAGQVIACTISVSSGSPSLDSRTCEIARAKVIFTPATDARGREIASTYTLPVRWALPDDGEGPTGPPIDLATAVPDDVAMELTLQLDGSGVVEQCTALKATPKSLGDPCAQYPVGKRWNTGAMRGGKPVRSQVVLRFSQTTTYKK